MKIAILGATGWIGSTLVNEARERDHDVIAIARNPNAIERDDVEKRPFDVRQPHNLAQTFQDADYVIAAIGGRANGDHSIVPETAQLLLTQLADVGVKRLLWVGGAGSLEVAPGVKLVTVPEFPEEYKAEALAQSDALDRFRSTSSPLTWTFISPAAEIFPGEKRHQYRVAGDQLLSDEEGKSQISVADYAAALLDVLETNQYLNQRIGVAY
ncbi:TPA: NAD(P)-dependent oxidoreductase [Vibrio vulnificus]|nr:NAD(P)-dependent oxidoreductase [Vibrio vulnificus]HAS8480431.1 NAD(P)-dependent oxidoreductase [Vibrio vulnificus]